MKGSKDNIMREYGLLKRLLELAGEGRFFWITEAIILLILAAGILISGLARGGPERTKIFSADEIRHRNIRKVAELPKEEKKEEALSTEETNSLEETYYSYVVSKIEASKIYPMEEQKKGHEGSVVMEIYLQADGSIRKVVVLRQARYVRLTKAAVESIRRALPFKEFPDGIDAREMVITVEMSFRLN